MVLKVLVCKSPVASFATAIVMAIGLISLSQIAQAGPAINQFELKDLEAEAGSLEFQSQNAHSWDQPRRNFAEETPGEFEYDENSVVRQRHALEMEMGFSRHFRFRVGIEFEKERLEDPSSLSSANDFDNLVLEEIAAEGVFILAPVPEQGGLGFGMLVEVEHPLEAGELNSVVFGPIIEGQSGPWSFVTNFALVKFFGQGSISEDGEIERDEKIDFTYAGQVKYQATEQLALTIESYGTIDRIWDTGRPGEEARQFGDHNLHRVGPILYYSFKPELGLHRKNLDGTSPEKDGDDDDEPVVTLGAGLLFGLNDNTPGTTAKWSIEVEF